MTTDDILDHLHAVMRRKRVTQQQIQIQLGWGSSYISQLLTGRKRLRIDILLDMLTALNISPVEFFAEIETPNPSNLAPLAALEDRVEHLETVVYGDAPPPSTKAPPTINTQLANLPKASLIKTL